jgi:hypothetical protein
MKAYIGSTIFAIKAGLNFNQKTTNQEIIISIITIRDINESIINKAKNIKSIFYLLVIKLLYQSSAAHSCAFFLLLQFQVQTSLSFKNTQTIKSLS